MHLAHAERAHPERHHSPASELHARRNSSDSFFELYSRVQALNAEPRQADGGVELFRKSKFELEQAILSGAGNELAELHALFALVEWLQPAGESYNRLQAVTSAYEHASHGLESKSLAAKSLSLFVQLRVLPFLIKSKIATEEDLVAARDKALSLAESLKSHSEWTGVLLEGVGYSYCQQERNRGTAVQHLSRSSSNLSAFLKSLSSDHKTEFSLLSAINAIALWDIGFCHESLAEEVPSKRMALELYHQARSKYSKAASEAENSTWLLYRALAHYAVAGTMQGEADLLGTPSKAAKKRLLKAAIARAEQGAIVMRRWCRLESAMLGGSLNARLYQTLGELETNAKIRRRLFHHSYRLAHKAYHAYAKTSGGRYSKANYGDVQFGLARFHLEEANTSQRKTQHLLRALEKCLESQKCFDDARHSDREVEALMLRARIERALGLSGISEHHNLAQSDNHCHKAIEVSRQHAWKEKIVDNKRFLAETKIVVSHAGTGREHPHDHEAL